MKLDMDLVRDILLKMEASEGARTQRDDLETLYQGQEAVRFHLHLMVEADYIREDTTQPAPGGAMFTFGLRPTWKGYEFLNDIRDPEIWGKSKERAKAITSVGVSLFWEIAKAEIKAKLGLP